VHQALNTTGDVSRVRVDQVYQSVLTGEANLIQAEASLEQQKDLYKDLLGLPPELPITLDDAVLAPFQLTDPALTTLRNEVEDFLAEYRRLDQAPPVVKLEEGFGKLKAYQTRTEKFVEEVNGEVQRWRTLLQQPDEDKDRSERERAALQELLKELEEVRTDLQRLARSVAAAAAAVTEKTRKLDWEALQTRTRDLSALVGQVVILQTRERVYLIRLRPVKYQEEAAIAYALDNRLDLMNQRAQVIDAWRQIDVTANALEADLQVLFSANIATPPGGSNPADFRASASSYTVGFHFGAPLDRLVARNAYRTSQINYQQARRSFMALEDQIGRAIRTDLRDLNAARLSFEIARQSLIAAISQVEAAQFELLLGGDPAATLNVLNAETQVLTANNGLINTWVSYETTRYRLLLDMEALQLDERGLYTDEHNDSAPEQPAGVPRPDAQSDGHASPP
jgi:outer membrane protein TolC